MDGIIKEMKIAPLTTLFLNTLYKEVKFSPILFGLILQKHLILEKRLKSEEDSRLLFMIAKRLLKDKSLFTSKMLIMRLIEDPTPFEYTKDLLEESPNLKGVALEMAILASPVFNEPR